MRKLLVLAVVLMGIGAIQAQEDAVTREAPYLYYYSDVLNAFVVERADGTDSRTLGEGLMPDDMNYFTGPGWSPSGRWFAWRAQSYRGVLGGAPSAPYAYVVSSSGEPFEPINGIQNAILSWSPSADLLLVIDKSEHSEVAENDPLHFSATFSLINMGNQREIIFFERDIVGVLYLETGISVPRWSLNGDSVTFGYAPYVDAEQFSSVHVTLTVDGSLSEERSDPQSYPPEIHFSDPASFATPNYTVYSPTGRYITEANYVNGVTRDTRTETLIEYPVHSLATFSDGRGNRWHWQEQYLIKGDSTVIAGGDDGFRVVGVTNSIGTYWRELGTCYFTQHCANWLPSQVDPDYLAPGSAESVQIAPMESDYAVEPIGDMSLIRASSHVFMCDEANDRLWITLQATGEHLYSIPLVGECAEDGLPVVSALSPDGRWLALGGSPFNPDYLGLWDLQAGEEIYRLPSAGYEIHFSDDGTHLYTRSRRAVLVWDVNEILRRAGIEEAGADT